MEVVMRLEQLSPVQKMESLEQRLDELKKLPGIGDIKAEAIIAYREETGRFNSIEDIMNVSGIKDSSYEQIKDYIKV